MTPANFWQTAAHHLEAGTPVFAALVVANTRGSPGTLGARLLLAADGSQHGTIGGGIMEADILRAARAGLRRQRDDPPQLQRLEHRNKPGTQHPSGLVCAGEQWNLNLWLQPQRDAATVRAFADAVAAQGANAVSLDIDADGLRITRDSAATGMQLQRHGQHWRYTESSLNPLRLAIAGGGHCGKALASLAAGLGYHVSVFDTRPDMLADDHAWPGAVGRTALSRYDELGDHLHHPELTTVVVMTTAMPEDIKALASVTDRDWPWLGVMGSRAKIHAIHEALAERGIRAARRERIHGPIGLPMKSDTPPEIAVSIMAELLVARND